MKNVCQPFVHSFEWSWKRKKKIVVRTASSSFFSAAAEENIRPLPSAEPSSTPSTTCNAEEVGRHKKGSEKKNISTGLFLTQLKFLCPFHRAVQTFWKEKKTGISKQRLEHQHHRRAHTVSHKNLNSPHSFSTVFNSMLRCSAKVTIQSRSGRHGFIVARRRTSHQIQEPMKTSSMKSKQKAIVGMKKVAFEQLTFKTIRIQLNSNHRCNLHHRRRKQWIQFSSETFCIASVRFGRAWSSITTQDFVVVVVVAQCLF